MLGKFGAAIKKLSLLTPLLCAMVVNQAHGQTVPDADRYVLQPGDELMVQYRYTPEFNQTLRIQPDGFVMLELVGELKIGGLTLAQARSLVSEKARVRLKEPEVSLVLKEFERPYFIVAGEVLNPGKFEIHPHTTALQAVMLAGGFKDRAKTSQVVVLRRGKPGQVEVKVVNLGKATKSGGQIEDLPLQPGDMVLIPQSTFSRIGRYLQTANVGMFFNPLQWLQ